MTTTTPVTPTVTFQRQTIADCYRELRPLLEAHWKEVAHYPDITLNVDWEAYIRMEQAGALRIYVLRDYGTLRGYAVFMVRENVHYVGSLQAVQDVVYLEPELRKQMIGARFLEWCDEQLAKEHVQVVYHHVKRTHDFGPTLQRLGYENIESVWGRRLDK